MAYWYAYLKDGSSENNDAGPFETEAGANKARDGHAAGRPQDTLYNVRPEPDGYVPVQATRPAMAFFNSEGA